MGLAQGQAQARQVVRSCRSRGGNQQATGEIVQEVMETIGTQGPLVEPDRHAGQEQGLTPKDLQEPVRLRLLHLPERGGHRGGDRGILGQQTQPRERLVGGLVLGPECPEAVVEGRLQPRLAFPALQRVLQFLQPCHLRLQGPAQLGPGHPPPHPDRRQLERQGKKSHGLGQLPGVVPFGRPQGPPLVGGQEVQGLLGSQDIERDLPRPATSATVARRVVIRTRQLGPPTRKGWTWSGSQTSSTTSRAAF